MIQKTGVIAVNRFKMVSVVLCVSGKQRLGRYLWNAVSTSWVFAWLRCTTRGGTVVKVSCYKSEDLWFDPLIRPQMNLWPPQRLRAVLWLLARYVSFTTERRRSQNPLELMDFLRRSRWKLYQRSHRKKQVADSLTVLDMPQ